MVRHSEVSNHLRKRRQTLSSVSSNVYSLTVRAYDLGKQMIKLRIHPISSYLKFRSNRIGLVEPEVRCCIFQFLKIM